MQHPEQAAATASTSAVAPDQHTASQAAPDPAPSVQPAAAPAASASASPPSSPAPPAAPAAAPVPVVVTSRLAHLEAVARAVVQTSTRSGITSARIDLRPPELGHIEIRLRYGSDGVTATVTASSPAAAQALGSSAGDLRRALEAQGLTVVGLDVGHTGAEDRPRPEGDAGQAAGGTGAVDAAGLDEDDDEATSTTNTRVPVAGSSMDVLA